MNKAPLMTNKPKISHAIAPSRSGLAMRTGLAGLLVLGLSFPSLAGEKQSDSSRHAALVTALRALESGDDTQATRAQAILLSVAPRGVETGDDPARELVAAYNVEPIDLTTSRGHIRGPVMRSGRLDSGVEEMDMVFEGGEAADVTLYAQGDRTLQIRVADTVLCQAQSQDGVAHCNWMPMFSKSHTIRIVREDEQSLPYTLIVN